MAYSDDQLDTIYHRCGGRCHLCHKRLARRNYAQYGSRGAWEVDHCRARANGGTNHGNNLRPACISCNRSKQHGSSRSVRTANGLTKAPLSTAARGRRQRERIATGSVTGLFIGSIFGGPAGAFVGSLVGAALGAGAEDE